MVIFRQIKKRKKKQCIRQIILSKVKSHAFLCLFSFHISRIVKLLEAGILDEWRRKWWSHDGLTCKPEARLGTGKNLGVIYLAGPFFVFAGASGLGFLLAGVEWAWRTDRFHRLVTYLCAKQKYGVDWAKCSSAKPTVSQDIE